MGSTGCQRKRRLDAVVLAARGVVRVQDESQGIPGYELLAGRHLLVLAAHIEERHVTGE